MPLESNCGREAEEETTARRQVELELPGVGGGGGAELEGRSSGRCGWRWSSALL